MNTQMMICMVIFAATLVSYMMNKIPMWLTAMLSLTALYFTAALMQLAHWLVFQMLIRCLWQLCL